MSITLRELAELVQGEVQGDASLPILAARTLGEAQPGHITFVENLKSAAQLPASQASAAVVSKPVPGVDKAFLIVKDPLDAFIKIFRHMHGRPEPAVHGIDPQAALHPTASIGADPSIHAFAAVGEGTVIGARCRIHSSAVVGRFCKLGDDVTIHPGAVLYDGTIVGQRVIVHASSVIGADGFGYRFVNGQHVKVPQLGWVELGDDVEIGACTTIDRGTFQATRIGAGTKIDNLVQVGHNCKIGRHNLFVSQMGIAGSSSTGDYVVVAGQVGIVDHVKIGDRVMIGAQAGVTKDVASGQSILGSPATPQREQKRMLMSLEKLPELRKDVRRIKEHLGLDDEPGAAEEKLAG